VLDGFFASSAAIACATIGTGQLRAAAHPSARRILRSAYLRMGRFNFSADVGNVAGRYRRRRPQAMKPSFLRPGLL
jgi:hypothetical protein